MIRRPSTAVAAAVLTCLILPAFARAAGQPEAAAPKGEATPLNLPTDGGGPAAQGASSGNLVRTIVGLAVVLGVIWGVYWILKQVKTSRETGSTGESLSTVASLALGPNRGLHLVRIGCDIVLVGVADHGITPIRSYSEAEAIAAGIIPMPARAEEAPQVRAGERRALLPGPQPRTVQALVGVIRERTVRS